MSTEIKKSQGYKNRLTTCFRVEGFPTWFGYTKMDPNNATKYEQAMSNTELEPTEETVTEDEDDIEDDWILLG